MTRTVADATHNGSPKLQAKLVWQNMDIIFHGPF